MAAIVTRSVVRGAVLIGTPAFGLISPRCDLTLLMAAKLIGVAFLAGVRAPCRSSSCAWEQLARQPFFPELVLGS